MRALVVVVGLLLACLPVTAEARPSTRPSKQQRGKVARIAVAKPVPKPRGQSVGVPWSGKLRDASKLREDKRYHLRRPHRTFATRTTVEHTRRALVDTLAQFPKLHALAVGDLSSPRGGWISEHNSHQSGRDVDLGLFYKQRPAGYPARFVNATANTLHVAATWALISNLASTQEHDGGVHIMFLDFDLQGVIYRWAQENGVSTRRLDRLFQYPHGRGASAGLIRHEPNHADHLHVRFRCAAADRDCR
ncbi:MAG: penicillin-insensitive murein endopeptidase [Myxococcota bacterium]|nr:penicillin-insensitive murein endopeptidase [Myxococcota bacterium]